jgi:chromosome segregation ATPase
MADARKQLADLQQSLERQLTETSDSLEAQLAQMEAQLHTVMDSKIADIDTSVQRIALDGREALERLNVSVNDAQVSLQSDTLAPMQDQLKKSTGRLIKLEDEVVVLHAKEARDYTTGVRSELLERLTTAEESVHDLATKMQKLVTDEAELRSALDTSTLVLSKRLAEAEAEAGVASAATEARLRELSAQEESLAAQGERLERAQSEASRRWSEQLSSTERRSDALEEQLRSVDGKHAGSMAQATSSLEQVKRAVEKASSDAEREMKACDEKLAAAEKVLEATVAAGLDELGTRLGTVEASQMQRVAAIEKMLRSTTTTPGSTDLEATIEQKAARHVRARP